MLAANTRLLIEESSCRCDFVREHTFQIVVFQRSPMRPSKGMLRFGIKYVLQRVTWREIDCEFFAVDVAKDRDGHIAEGIPQLAF